MKSYRGQQAKESKYRISDKGMEFLRSYQQFKGFAEGFGLKV